jgi:hypothetical protein
VGLDAVQSSARVELRAPRVPPSGEVHEETAVSPQGVELGRNGELAPRGVAVAVTNAP